MSFPIHAHEKRNSGQIIEEITMKRFVNMRTMIVTLILLVGSIPVAAVERPFASHGNGTAIFITDGAGNILGATLNASGTATHLGMWTAVGRLQFTPDADNPTIIHPSGEATYTAANGDKLLGVLQNGVLDVTTGIARGTWSLSVERAALKA
jgi:hypothetical protein